MKRALITGITGQDGSYLAELLLAKGYEVHGIKRRESSHNTRRIDRIVSELHLHYGDVTDLASVVNAIELSRPNEIYNLAAQSHVRVSLDMPIYTLRATGEGAVNVFEAARLHAPDARIYQASSSEMFGSSPAPQNEDTQMLPTSPYGCAKLYSHRMANFYRVRYGMFIACGILFNHESPRRGETFVTKKICRAVARGEHVALGNVEARRDWGYASEYVEAMWLMLQHGRPLDLVIGTGEMHSVHEWLTACGTTVWQTDERLLRDGVEVNELRADARRAKAILGWEPKTKFRDLVEIMMAAEYAEVQCAA